MTADVKRTPARDERGGAAEGGKKDGVIRKKSDTLAAYSAKVEKIRHYIREGHIFQTVLSQRWTVETGRDGFSLYKELRELNPSPYLYYFQFGNFEVIGSSPEMLVNSRESAYLPARSQGPDREERQRRRMKRCAENFWQMRKSVPSM